MPETLEPETLERDLRETTHDIPDDWRSRGRIGTLRDRFGKRLTPALIGIGLVLVLAAIGLSFFAQSMSYESTDDAFIDGHIVQVSPKIAGRIDKVFIDDNQPVKKGDPIVQIDPRDYDAQLKQKQAALESIKAEAIAAQAAVEQQIATVKSLQATVDQDKADQQASGAQAHQTADNLRRQQDLYDNRVVSIQDLINARDSDRSAQANLEAAKMKVLSAEAQLLAWEAQVRTFQALLQYVLAQEKENDANVESAQLNDSYTKVFAPESGRVTHKSVEPGDYVQVGQNLLALVPSNIWVTANFKENQLRLMRPGQPVEIQVDALGGRKFKGHVDSIQMGSGAAFSLLPPENATGNYVKVVQRVPVKILFDPLPDVGLPLGPGESVVPTVKVQDFHYSAWQLMIAAVLTGAAILLVLRWGTTPPKPKKNS
ncbi:MAG TPA: HlyD family secretion protein [Chthoniobacterales bacterium]|nr:HlyD family secretion protein [Chthoniobacterales bacterium]